MATHLWHAAKALREYALAFPEAWEDFPWGDRVVKVGKKIFVFLGAGADAADGVSIGDVAQVVRRTPSVTRRSRVRSIDRLRSALSSASP